MKATENKPDCYQIGDLSLNAGTVTLTRRGKEIALPKLSFELLLCLARYAPNVVTTDTLMHEVWGKVVVNDETVKQRIKLLRQALGDNSSAPRYIAAVRGRGYRVIAAVSSISPEGTKAPAVDRPPRSVAPWLMGAFALAVVAITGLTVWLLDDSDRLVNTTVIETVNAKRVVVLPFKNFSGQAGDEYLADGITEDIISALAQVSDLGVIARTTAMHFKNSSRRISDIAGELQVGTVLEGSIQRFGDQLRITVQMIDATTEEHYWAQTYDVSLPDLPRMQAEVAERVATALKATISEVGLETLKRGSTKDPKAYDAYLKGRAAYRRWTRPDNETALAFYQQAVDLDPEFALAIAGIANAQALRASKFGLGHEWIEEAIRQARRALDLNPDLPEAHKALGISFYYEGRYQQALDYYREALRLEPNYDEAIYNIAEIYQIQGRWDESVRYQLLDSHRPFGLERLSIYLRNLRFYEQAEAMTRKFKADLPLAFFTDENLSVHYLVNGEFDQARQATRRMQQSFPDIATGWLREGEIDLFTNELAAAEKNIQTAVAMPGLFQNYARLRLAHLQLLRGDSDSADLLLRPVEAYSLQAINNGHEAWFHRWNLAFINSLSGNKEAALSWYERAVDSGRRSYEWDERDSAFQLIADEPRFLAALQRQRDSRLQMKQKVAELLEQSGLDL